MLLKSIKLDNIRSYQNATITFPEGSTVLAGDIGSGKSSILLAIEFALFGTSRPDLPAEFLLRKGTTIGSVELSFQLHNQEIIIKRSLKKEKRGIKQLPGYIIKNNVKKECMPIELKSEIISLLGYPEDLVTKNKNYLFRYTVYTPQEEMKFILQENPEIRLDALRKIFNIDKYKIIRENLQFILKKMRTEIAILKTRTESFEDLKDKQKKVLQEKEVLQGIISKLQPQVKKYSQEKKIIQEQLEEKEKQHEQFLQQRESIQKLSTIIKEKEKQLQQITEKVESLMLETSSSEHFDTEQVKEEFANLQIKRNHLLQKRATCEQKSKQLLLTMSQLQEEIKEYVEISTLLPKKEELLQKLVHEISRKEEFRNKRKQLEELERRTSELVTKNHTLLQQSRQLQNLISSLSQCPTCLQEVSINHKEMIHSGETAKITQAENLLFELTKKKSEINKEKEIIIQKIDDLTTKEKNHAKVNVELIQLREKFSSISGKKDKLRLSAQENNKIMQELQELPTTEELDKKIKDLQNILNLAIKQELQINQLKDLQNQKSILSNEIKVTQQEITKVQELTIIDPGDKIKELRLLLQELQEKEKSIVVSYAENKTKLDNIIKIELENRIMIQNLTEQRNQLIQQREVYHWLESFFLKLTYTIEKRIMTNIHHVFNELFQEWFSILIEDDQIYSRIDDSFSPIIEINGYEVSFNNLSGGEKTSAALAYRLALNRVINDVIHEVKTKDVLILDEPTDGFSSEQLDKVRDVLDKLQLQQTIIVSHESKIESFVENVIRIRKEGHVSSVV